MPWSIGGRPNGAVEWRERAGRRGGAIISVIVSVTTHLVDAVVVRGVLGPADQIDEILVVRDHDQLEVRLRQSHPFTV